MAHSVKLSQQQRLHRMRGSVAILDQLKFIMPTATMLLGAASLVIMRDGYIGYVMGGAFIFSSITSFFMLEFAILRMMKEQVKRLEAQSVSDKEFSQSRFEEERSAEIKASLSKAQFWRIVAPVLCFGMAAAFLTQNDDPIMAHMMGALFLIFGASFFAALHVAVIPVMRKQLDGLLGRGRLR